ncbi:MAG: four helix bundle protein [Planctomycetota bacterium]
MNPSDAESSPIRSYRNLDVWQVVLDLVEEIYRLTKSFPADERCEITSQMRRAAVSVPSNIAEGYGRSSRKEYRRHVSIANGSLSELKAQFIIAGRLGFVTRDEGKMAWELIQQSGRMLAGLIRSWGKPA